jgi:hypothetical protein
MTNDQLKKLETLHAEAEQTAAAFHAIAIRAEAGSETAKQFKKLADTAPCQWLPLSNFKWLICIVFGGGFHWNIHSLSLSDQPIS